MVWQFLNKNLRQLALRLKPYLLGYNSYTCLLTQSGTDDPVAVVLHNSLGINVEFYYGSSGQYLAIINKALFESPNEYVTITSGTYTNQLATASLCNVIETYPVFVNAIAINSYTDGSLADSVIGVDGFVGVPCIFEIRKYY